MNMDTNTDYCIDCGDVAPFAARRCVPCAHDRVTARVWWNEFALSFKSIATWYTLNSGGVFAISQRDQGQTTA